MSAHRNNQLNIPGIASNNWNGHDNSGLILGRNWTQYVAFVSSSLVDGGITVLY